MQILLDMDGVIADFTGAAAKLHGRDPTTATSWDFMEAWGIEPEVFWAPMGRQFWATVPKTPEADKVVRLCELAADGQVCLLSSPCMTEGCMEGKLDWINEHFPQFSRKFLFGPAKQFCTGPERLLVDDSDANVVAFGEGGGLTCLFPRPWNVNRHMNAMRHLRWCLGIKEG